MIRISAAVLAVGCLASVTFGVHADETRPVTAPAAKANPFADAKRVNDKTLHAVAGRADLSQAVIANNSSNVSNNSVSGHSTTGTISLDGQAFQDLRGLSVLSANTGNNVSINASMNVNVALRQ